MILNDYSKTRKLSAAILAIIITVIMLMPFLVPTAYAETGSNGMSKLSLDRDKCMPEDGDKNVPTDNVGFRLFFNQDFNEDEIEAANSNDGKTNKYFIVTSSGDKKAEIRTIAYVNPKENNYVIVTATKFEKNKKGKVVQVPLKPKTKYTLTIKADLMAANGSTLSEDETLTFTTIDTAASTKGYMILMVIMIVGMIGMSRIQKMRKKKLEEERTGMKAVNVYKLAKEKGISVQEAQAIVDDKKRKFEKRMKRAGMDPKAIEKKERDELRKKGIYRVHGPHKISSGGSTYKHPTKRKPSKKPQPIKKKSGNKGGGNKGGNNKKKK
jgi:hypothetical protein